MRWGIRKDRIKDTASTKRKSTPQKKTRRITKQTVRQIGGVALNAITISALLAGAYSTYVDSGKVYANSYLVSNGTTPYSQAKKEVDRSDWTWADYAWAEVEG